MARASLCFSVACGLLSAVLCRGASLGGQPEDTTSLVQGAVRSQRHGQQRQPWLVPVQPMPPAPWATQPMPWAQPQSQPTQPMPWMAPPQPAAPPLPWQQPQSAVPAPVGPSAAQAPMNRYIFTLIPDNKMMCLQGPKGYLMAALARLQTSPLSSHYSGSQVTVGMCNNFSYHNGPYPGTCFPRAAIYTDNDPLHVMTMIDFDESEAQFYAGARNIPVEAAMAELKSACDEGSMEQGLQLASEETMAQVYVPPQVALIPDNGMSCMQGTMEYLNDALKQIRTTKLAKLFEKSSGPVPGMCSEHGYTVGSGGVVSAGHGRIKSKCFPKATMFWDKNETHHDQLMWFETRALKGASHNFNFSKYEENREEVQEICGGRSETIYRPMPPNLR